MSALGNSRPTNSTPVPDIVRYAPLATKMLWHPERNDVSLTAAIPGLLMIATHPPSCKVPNRSLESCGMNTDYEWGVINPILAN